MNPKYVGMLRDKVNKLGLKIWGSLPSTTDFTSSYKRLLTFEEFIQEEPIVFVDSYLTTTIIYFFSRSAFIQQGFVTWNQKFL